MLEVWQGRNEHEGYNLDGGDYYLPDFLIPRLNVWIEIKPTKPDQDACRKAEKLARFTDRMVYIFFGDVAPPDAVFGTTEDSAQAYAFWPTNYGSDHPYLWCECPSCGALGIEFDGRSDRLGCKCTGPGCPRSPHGDKGYNARSPRLLEAYDKARMMRF
jgi:hypothetical protein